MILNLLVIGFLLGMAFRWSSQGLFSAILHLAMVIAAGTLALALWEPVTQLILNLPAVIADHIRYYAWGVGLLLPFVLLLAVLRSLCDRAVPGNVHVHGVISQVGGGLFGLFAGVLTAGLGIIGLNFLGGAPSLAGYQPYIVAGDGEVEANPDGGGLWLKVDHWAAGFFSHLSQAGFGDGLLHSTPLATERPDLARQAAIFTLRYDPHASLVAGADAVRLEQTHMLATSGPDALQPLPADVRDVLGGVLSDGRRLVVVDSTWANQSGAYDLDATLRIPPTQVRLLTHPERAGRGGAEAQAELHAPVGFVRFAPGSERREFYPIDNARIFASSTSPEQGFGWVFIVPENREPEAIYLRQLRLPITEPIESAQQIAQALGSLAVARDEEDEDDDPQLAGDEEIDEGEDAPEITLTNSLPRAISVNEANRLTYGEDNVVISGRDEATRQPTGRSEATRSTAIHEPGHMVMVRLEFTGDRARSLLGRIRDTAAAVQEVFLMDDRGQPHYPIGYVLERENRTMELNFLRGEYIRNATQLPINRMGDQDQLYLYFRIGRDQNATITGYQVGDYSREGLNVPVR